MKTNPTEAEAGSVEEKGWKRDLPNESGLWWWWNGDQDSSPIPLNIALSGGTNPERYFVMRGQYGIAEAINVEVQGGYWMRLHEPATSSSPVLAEPEAQKHRHDWTGYGDTDYCRKCGTLRLSIRLEGLDPCSGLPEAQKASEEKPEPMFGQHIREAVEAFKPLFRASEEKEAVSESVEVSGQKTLSVLLDEIEARANSATAGPWEKGAHNLSIISCSGSVIAHAGVSTTLEVPAQHANARLIAAARSDVPALCAALQFALKFVDNKFDLNTAIRLLNGEKL